MKYTLLLAAFLLAYSLGYSQQEEGFKWWNPAQHEFPVLEGQAWPGELKGTYNRLPARAQQDVREAVWTKSQQSAGVLVRFLSDASSIHVRYKVKGAFAFEHMPATGVSGVDLYAINKKGQWEWTGANYTYGDTVRYYYDAIRKDGLREYHLYLPLYNKVEWLEIGVPENAVMKPLPLSKEKPIVVYGSSIAQGGCASRPGMAWTAILDRQLRKPVINLGFSSNGLLEKPLIDLMSEMDAALYVLDCMPNLSSYPGEEVSARLVASVKALRKVRPSIPVLVVENADGNIGMLDTLLDNSFKQVNKVASATFQQLKEEGIKNIYFLSAAEIGLDIDCTVDGQHPNDLGMKRYADAYEKCIRKIFKR
ncbi:SGNH/GDSL hydrolase family protein [Chitinophaga sp. MM2321]|uniref:SGNH/GDSL hydrolase family protein n=1 Tax=Chitinophaga sp. MM2321 TaxID=3137178 RepID=UPI0032D5873D